MDKMKKMKQLKIQNTDWFKYNGCLDHDKIAIPLIIEHMIFDTEIDDWVENEEWENEEGTATEILKENPNREIAWFIMEDYLKQAFEMAFGEDVMKNITISIGEKNNS